MTESQQLFESVLIMLILILLSAFLLRIKVLEKSNSLFTSKLVLKVTLPALILSSLASSKINIDFLITSGVVAIAEIICILLAFGIAMILKFDKPKTGALMLVSAFGMSTMLGYPIIRQVFPGNVIAMDKAVITGEIGVGLLLFILAPIISMYYGSSEFSGKNIITSIKHFLISPIFISIILGISISLLPIDRSCIIYNGIHKILTHLGSANMFLVAVTVGLLLKLNAENKIIVFITIAIGLKLIIEPLVTYYFSGLFNVNELSSQIATIETAMPSATLAAIFARQYNLKPELVSTTILITLLVSLITVTGMFTILY